MNSALLSWVQFEAFGGAVSEKDNDYSPFSNRKALWSMQ